MPSSDSDSDDQGVQVRVSLKLAASVQDRSLEIPTEPIAVPADIGRKGLSAVLNHLLGRSVVKDGATSDSEDEDEDEDKLPPLNFEFVVFSTNKLLRKGVEKEARQHGLSLEQAITITYFPATSAPDLADEQEELPDWISCLSSHQDTLLAGCYDGSLHLYKQKNGQLEKENGALVSSGPVKCLATVVKDETMWIAAASLDHSLQILNYTNDKTLETYGQCIQEGTSCAITSLDFASSSTRLASGDGNGTVCIWDVQNINESVKPTKKVKTNQGKKSNQSIAPHISMESAHSQLVSGLSWGNHSTDNQTHLISGSWDHSIKLWDVEAQDCLLTLNGARVVSCLDTSYHSEGVVATGHPDCTIRLWDLRTNNTKQSSLISDNTFRPSHKEWVSSVKWSKSNAYHLASTSHDGTIKMWDIRSSVPLHTVRAFPKEEKALCLACESSTDSKSTGVIFAGGTDCILKQLRL